MSVSAIRSPECNVDCLVCARFQVRLIQTCADWTVYATPADWTVYATLSLRCCFYLYARAVGQVLGASNYYCLAACQTLLYLDPVAKLAAHSDGLRYCVAITDYKHRGLAVSLLNCRLWDCDSRSFALCTRLLLLDECLLCIHIRKDSRIDFIEAHFDFDRSLLTIRGGNYLADFAR